MCLRISRILSRLPRARAFLRLLLTQGDARGTWPFILSLSVSYEKSDSRHSRGRVILSLSSSSRRNTHTHSHLLPSGIHNKHPIASFVAYDTPHTRSMLIISLERDKKIIIFYFFPLSLSLRIHRQLILTVLCARSYTRLYICIGLLFFFLQQHKHVIQYKNAIH